MQVGKRILEMFGYDSVTLATDGRVAIEAVEQKQVGLILFSLQMPVLEGFATQEQLKENPLAGRPCVAAFSANAEQVKQFSSRWRTQRTLCLGHVAALESRWLLRLPLETTRYRSIGGRLTGGLRLPAETVTPPASRQEVERMG